MLKNYFKTAWRSLWLNKITSLVSLTGLILGVACFFLLATYILNELRYDRFHENAGRIMFVNFNYKMASDADAVHASVTPTGVVPVAKREFPAVENGTRVYKYNNKIVGYGDKQFSEKSIWMADDAFFKIFSFHFLEGNPLTALKEPHSFVITKSIARKYFGDKPALGKILKIDSSSWQVTGVIENIPSYSSLKFDMMGSYITLPRSKTENWSAANDLSFLLLKSPTQQNAVQQGINKYVEKKFPEEFKSGNKFWFELEPLTRMHLYSKAAAQGNVKYLYIFGGIALLLLVIACINFTNLVTAKSTERAREIGVRKVFGAARKNIFLQFMTESAIITLLALGTGILISYLTMPFFNSITGLALSLKIWERYDFIGIIFVLFFVITFLAGAWPALVISRFRPIFALKSNPSPVSGSGTLRKFLVVFQFTISIAFIIATFVARRQLHFIQHTDTGINRSQIVVLDGSNIKARQFDALKSELLKNKNVKAVTGSYDSPINVQGGYEISVAGENGNNELSVTAIPVDKDFINTLGMKIIRGTNFTYADEQLSKIPNDEKREYAFMLNSTAVKALGLTPENAIGKPVNMNGRHGKIKAILEDFNFASLHQLIRPIVVFVEYNRFGEILIKTSGADTRQALSGIKKTWKSFYPHQPFEYHFLDDEYNELYKTEQRTTAILNIFSIITILVSCLGLFGLSIFMATQRTKEIGIRKVLGATVVQITALLSRDFLKLVAVSALIASPVAWYGMNKWLQDFAYRVNISWWIFAAAGLSAVVIALITVSFQAIKSAIANPVKSLRSE